MVDGYDDLDERDGYAAAGQDALIELNALLGRGTRYSGKLHFDGRVRIEGAFDGEIHGDDVLVIGEGAEVDGTIEVGCCIVTGGVVRASIRAVDAIELHAPAEVYGDLHAPNIFIDRGVQFEGSCKMAPLSDRPPPNKPQARKAQARKAQPRRAPLRQAARPAPARAPAKTIAAAPVLPAQPAAAQPVAAQPAAPQPVAQPNAPGQPAAARQPPSDGTQEPLTEEHTQPSPLAAQAAQDRHAADDEYEDEYGDYDDEYEDDEYEDDEYEDGEYEDDYEDDDGPDARAQPEPLDTDDALAALEPQPRKRSRKRLPRDRHTTRSARREADPRAAEPQRAPPSQPDAVEGVRDHRRRRGGDQH